MELKEIQDQLDGLKADLLAKVPDEVKKELKSVEDKIIAIEKSIDTKAFDELKTTLAEIKTAAEKNQPVIDALVAEGTKKKVKGNQFAAEIKEKKETIKTTLKQNGQELELKATTLRDDIATNNHVLQIDGIGQLTRKARSLYDIFRKIPVSNGNHNGKIAYTDWDEASVVKAAAAVAEGAAFPESTAKFKGYTLDLRKIGDTLPVSEEFFEDEEMAAAELAMFIDNNVDSAIDDQIVNGDNTGQNLKGLLVSVPTYVAAAAGITDANIYDLIVKMKESITKTMGKKYLVDFAAMNETTVNMLVLKKDDNNQYIFPPNHPIYNMIVVDNYVTDNNIVVGDSRYGKIYEKSGVVISRDTINAQFTEDMITLKARKRLGFLIREADKTGFAKVTNVAASLATLAGS